MARTKSSGRKYFPPCGFAPRLNQNQKKPVVEKEIEGKDQKELVIQKKQKKPKVKKAIKKVKSKKKKSKK